MWVDKYQRCTSNLHDYPLSGVFAAASVQAAKRILGGWKNVECAHCGLYGWIPPQEGK